jgi:serine acetyltransferase
MIRGADDQTGSNRAGRPGDAPHRRINRLLKVGFTASTAGHARTALVIDAITRVVFSADIPSRLRVPEGVTFMHNGLGTSIDGNVKFLGPALVYPGVTIGFAITKPGGVPTIGNHVIIGAGAVIVGEVTIGDRSVVGANAVVTRDVPADHQAFGNPAQLRPVNPEVSRDIWPDERP